MNRTRVLSSSLGALVLTAATLAGSAARPTPAPPGAWASDPAWFGGEAEWALYDAVRPIYGVPRRYEATLFTNRQHMDPATTTKAADWRAAGAVDVFKHNVSELIETEHYTYRFLTTCFVRAGDLSPYKVVFSSQEDCGTTYKQFVVADDRVQADSYCYFPGDGAAHGTFDRPAHLAFHDALSLTLRDYPFGADEHPEITLDLVPDQTDTHRTGARPAPARVTYAGRETLEVPYGAVDAHHLQVTHAADGGAKTTDLWFAADPALRHVMVRYAGPYGVRYELKGLGMWAYWDRSAPRPDRR